MKLYKRFKYKINYFFLSKIKYLVKFLNLNNIFID